MWSVNRLTLLYVRGEAVAVQEHLLIGTENLPAGMEHFKRRVKEQPGFPWGGPFAGLGSVGGFESPSSARRAAGSGYIQAGLRFPRLAVSSDSGGVSSAQRVGGGNTSSRLTKQDELCVVFPRR